MEQLSLFDFPTEEKIEKALPKVKVKQQKPIVINEDPTEALIRKHQLEQSLKIQEYDMLEISKEVFQEISEYYKTDKLKLVAFNNMIAIHSSNDMFSCNRDWENLQKLEFYKKYNVIMRIYPSSIYVEPNIKLYEKIKIQEQERFQKLMEEYGKRA